MSEKWHFERVQTFSCVWLWILFFTLLFIPVSVSIQKLPGKSCYIMYEFWQDRISWMRSVCMQVCVCVCVFYISMLAGSFWQFLMEMFPTSDDEQMAHLSVHAHTHTHTLSKRYQREDTHPWAPQPSPELTLTFARCCLNAKIYKDLLKYISMPKKHNGDEGPFLNPVWRFLLYLFPYAASVQYNTDKSCLCTTFCHTLVCFGGRGSQI